MMTIETTVVFAVLALMCARSASGEVLLIDPCFGKVNGFHGIPNACEKFVFCLNGDAFISQCPIGQMWNKLTNRCALPSVVPAPCGNATAVPFSCADKKVPGMYRDEKKCNTFYSCNSTTEAPKPQMCAAGMAFSNVTNTCEPAISVPGCAPSPAASLFPFCAEQDEDGLYANPNNCGQAIACIEDIAFKIGCPPELPHFDNKTLNCVVNVPGCVPPTNVTATPATEDQIKQFALLSGMLPKSPECAGLPDGIYPYKNMTTNATVCEKWTLCALGMAAIMDCPFGQVFSTDKNQCVLKGLVSQPCGLLPVVAPLKPSCLLRKDGELFKDPAGSCSLYYSCNNGTLTNGTCAPGTALNVLTQNCTDASKVIGCAPPAANNLATFCLAQKKNGIYTDPLSCTRAIVCLGNTHFYYMCNFPGLPYFSAADGLRCVKDAPSPSCKLNPTRRRRHALHHRHGYLMNRIE